MKKPIIAIDGYSSTGKSSVSKEIARRLGILHMDTGALYRGITLFALQNFSKDGLINLEALLLNLDKINMDFRQNGKELELFLNGENVAQAIRRPEISANVSLIAKQKEVRDFLMSIQQDIAEKNGVVMDGRDIGTVVLPNADYKFFLTAEPSERAKRRFIELSHAGEKTDEETVKAELLARDKADSEREISPLKQAEDALLIDNTNISKEETVELILSYIK